MNEIIFFTQITIIIVFAFRFLKAGKEALTAWIAIQALLANLFVIKQVSLFGFDVTASDAFAIGSILGLNFLQEYYGKEEANKATVTCFLGIIFFAIVSKLHLLFDPALHDTSSAAFEQILSPTMRLSVASMAVFFIVQQCDIKIFSVLKQSFPKLNFSTRVAISLIASQLIDTILFSYAGLYGMVNSLFDIIIFSLTIKLIVIFCITPTLRWAKT